jgi:hypothetical protein
MYKEYHIMNIGWPPHGIVWENVYARVPLPRDIFNGPYDERYGLDGNDMTRVFCGSSFEEFDQ